MLCVTICGNRITVYKSLSTVCPSLGKLQMWGRATFAHQFALTCVFHVPKFPLGSNTKSIAVSAVNSNAVNAGSPAMLVRNMARCTMEANLNDG